MDHDHDHDAAGTAQPRRAFLRRIGATVAAGVGLAAFGAAPAGARRPNRQSSCVHFCRQIECGSGQCAYPTPHLVRCDDECSGSSYYYCSDRPGCPQSWCVSTVCL